MKATDKDTVNGKAIPQQQGLFRGAAEYYARYRRGYPNEFLAHVVSWSRLSNGGTVLDLGCGTGQLAVPLAVHAERVVGVDPDPEMLEQAAASAREAGVRNATWLLGRSSDLVHLAPAIGPLALTAIGNAFHWMDRRTTLVDLDAMTERGGGVAVVSNGGSIWTAEGGWQEVVRKVVQRWLGPERRAGAGHYAAPAERHEDVLAGSAFAEVTEYRRRYVETMDADVILGRLYSTSFAAPPLFGDRLAAFEDDLRGTLHRLEPSDSFEEEWELRAFLAKRRGHGRPP